MSSQQNETLSVDALAGDLFGSIVATQKVQAAYLGSKLGWYDCFAKRGALTPAELAKATSTSERYAREWCEQQTVAGWISCKDPSVENRKFYLNEAQKEVFTNRDSLAHLLPVCVLQASLGKGLDRMIEAYKNNTGISWDELGPDARECQAAANRPLFLHSLGKDYLSKIPEVNKALRNGGRVADIGAGFAWSSIGVAKSFPNARVDAYDLDEESIKQAKVNIAAYGVKDRVTARCIDAGKMVDKQKPYDLVMALECIHDMGDPVSVLKTMKKLAGNKGTVLIMDEKTEEKFSGKPGNDLEAFLYGFSITCCLLDCKSHPNSAETGTVMRPSKLNWYAIEAGFRGAEILPLEHDAFNFYRLIINDQEFQA